MNEVQVFNYNESPITFNHGDKMVNATEMAKPFGKRTTEWMSNKATKEFLIALSQAKGIPTADIVRVENGNGTWMHEDAALEFARWLSPAFGIWCNDRIKELMTHGITATPQTIDSILANPENAIRMLTALQVERQEKEKAIAQNIEQQKQIVQLEGMIAENKTRVDFANHFVETEGVFKIRDAWKKLRAMGVEIIRLHGEIVRLGDNFKEWLRENKFIFPYTEEAYSQFIDRGILQVDMVENRLQNKIYPQIKITSKGIAYFYKILNNVQQTIKIA